MSERSPFEKIHVDERDKADLGGVLDQLNLPPAVIDFVRRNQKSIFIIIGVVSVIVVVWALYGSYVDNRRAESSTALTVAKNLEDEKRKEALEQVAVDYSGTDAANWAKIELARDAIQNNNLEKALQHYGEVSEDISTTNPLYPLITFGLAQVQESLAHYDEAIQQYTTLKNITGYESIGYNGTARIYEIQGNIQSAINEYEQYRGTLSGDSTGTGEHAYITEKISRLKASM